MTVTVHFKRDNKPLTWLVARHLAREETAVLCGSFADKLVEWLPLLAFKVPLPYYNDRYIIVTVFDNDADEAEFIMKYSDGIEL